LPDNLIVGRGNPGERYASTRHNIGFVVARRIADAWGVRLKQKGHQAVYGWGQIEGYRAGVLLPQTYMNRSGSSVASACRQWQIPLDHLLVIHDDLDLPFGSLRFKRGGGHGGHNGLRHIAQTLGKGDFDRMRVGVGRPPESGDVVSYVLQRFSRQQQKELPALLETAQEAALVWLAQGVDKAMNAYNGA